jgi:hypothetical protein
MMRFKIFSENVKTIEELQNENGANYGLNEFTHLTEEEFKNKFFSKDVKPPTKDSKATI